MSATGFVEVEDGKLHFECDGNGPPVVLVHGGLFLDQRMWEPQVAALSPTHTVVRFDLRGYGRSTDPPDHPYRHCDDVRSVLEHLGFPSASFVGNSFGATVAVDVALAHPELVDGLVLAPLAPLLGHDWVTASPVAPVIESARTSCPAAAKAAMRDLPFFAEAIGRLSIAGPVERMYADYSGWHLGHRDPAVFAFPDAADHLGQIRMPVLTIDGEQDHREVRIIHDRLTAELPSCDAHLIAGAAHLPNMEAPAVFNDLLIRFLAATA